MSRRAQQYVRGVRTTAKGAALSSAEKLVLRALADAYRDEVNCAFTSNGKLAEAAGLSASHCRRVVARLEDAGLVLRHASVRDADGSQTSNEYELPALTRALAGDAELAARKAVFRFGRTRVAVQRALPLAKGSGDGVDSIDRSDEGVCPAAMYDAAGGEGGCPAGGSDVWKEPGAELGAPADRELPPPTHWGLPSEPLGDSLGDPVPPYAPPAAPQAAENHPSERRTLAGDPRAAGYSERQRQKQLQKLPDQGEGAALGAAAAGMEAVASAEILQNAAGAAGTATATATANARVVEFPGSARRRRQPREAAAVRQYLDGEEAAVWDEVTRVLAGCGVAPETAGRKVREAVGAALRLYAAREGECLAAAGDTMIKMWALYGKTAALLAFRRGFLGWVTSGEWQNSSRWAYDRERVTRYRNGGR